jgi:hypothetical protein
LTTQALNPAVLNPRSLFNLNGPHHATPKV